MTLSNHIKPISFKKLKLNQVTFLAVNNAFVKLIMVFHHNYFKKLISKQDTIIDAVFMLRFLKKGYNFQQTQKQFKSFKQIQN